MKQFFQLLMKQNTKALFQKMPRKFVKPQHFSSSPIMVHLLQNQHPKMQQMLFPVMQNWWTQQNFDTPIAFYQSLQRFAGQMQQMSSMLDKRIDYESIKIEKDESLDDFYEETGIERLNTNWEYYKGGGNSGNGGNGGNGGDGGDGEGGNDGDGGKGPKAQNIIYVQEAWVVPKIIEVKKSKDEEDEEEDTSSKEFEALFELAGQAKAMLVNYKVEVKAGGGFSLDVTVAGRQFSLDFEVDLEGNVSFGGSTGLFKMLNIGLGASRSSKGEWLLNGNLSFSFKGVEATLNIDSTGNITQSMRLKIGQKSFFEMQHVNSLDEVRTGMIRLSEKLDKYVTLDEKRIDEIFKSVSF